MPINPAAFSEYDPSFMATGWATPFGEEGIASFAGNLVVNTAIEQFATRGAYGFTASAMAQFAGVPSEAFEAEVKMASKKQFFAQRIFGTTQPGLAIGRQSVHSGIIRRVFDDTAWRPTGIKEFDRRTFGQFEQIAKRRARKSGVMFAKSRPVAALEQAFSESKVMSEALERAVSNKATLRLPLLGEIPIKGSIGMAKGMEWAGLAFHGAAKFFAFQGIMGLTSAYGDIYEGVASYGRSLRKQKEFTMTEMGGQFFDNRGAATMRQRSLAAIHNTQSQLRQVFGREATVVHQ